MTDNDIEQELQTKGLNAPRLAPADIEAEIVSEYYFTASEGLIGCVDYDEVPDFDLNSLDHVTLCVIILRNGFKVVGVNTGTVSPGNFDANLGRQMARKNAIDQIWPLMGYALKERLYRQQQMQPTYFVKHPDESFSVAEPQPLNPGSAWPFPTRIPNPAHGAPRPLGHNPVG